jgi:Cof subfamily protein (haloacid dehalogenase superfamily)
MTKNLIAIDMDGTLLNEKQQISPENREAIKLRAKEDLVYICSGRDFFDICTILERSNLQIPVASLNGSFILDGETKIFSNPFTKVEVFAIFQHIEELPFKLFTNKGTYNAPSYMDRMRKFFKKYGELVNKEKETNNLNYLIAYEKSTDSKEYTEKLFDDEELEVYKIAIYLPESTFSQNFYQKIKKEFQLPITSSGLNDYELLPLGVDKGKTYDIMMAYFGVPAAKKVAIGDSPNDLPMMTVADLSFAVENASEEVKAACSHVVPSNDDHGVAYVLNNINLF